MKKSERYYGVLNVKQTIEGIDYCFKNAISLYEEAKILSDANRNTRAVYLLLSCLEELSKPQLIALIYRTPDNFEKRRRSRWDNFYKHSYKHGSTFAWKYMSTSKSFAQAVSLSNKAMEDGNILSALREKILYVGFDKDAIRWNRPMEINLEELKALIKFSDESMERMRRLIGSGFFSEVALIILKEHYEKLEMSMPDSFMVDLETLNQLEVPKLHRQYFDKLTKEGIVFPGNINMPD